jgi:hypothetical protein
MQIKILCSYTDLGFLATLEQAPLLSIQEDGWAIEPLTLALSASLQSAFREVDIQPWQAKSERM